MLLKNNSLPEIAHHRRPFAGLLLLLFCLAVLGLLRGAVPAPRNLRVVLDNNYPPYVFLDADGKLQGMLVDQWRLFEKKTGISVELVGLSWGDALLRMEKGEFDVIDTIFENDEREHYFDFTAAYQKIEVPIFFRTEITGITGLKSLRGFPVAVKDGDDAVGLLRSGGVETLVLFDSYEAIVTAAKEHKISVFVVDRPPALHYLHKLGLERQFRESAPLKEGAFHRAVRKGDRATLQAVEHGFEKITPEELSDIREKWCGYEPFGMKVSRWLMIGGAVLLLVAAVVALKIVFLRRAVRKQSAALTASEDRFHSIFNAVSDAVFIHELKTGRILDVNDRTCEMYRCTREQARHCGLNEMSEGVAPYNEEAASRRFQKAAADGVPQVFPWRCRRLDGTVFWGEVRMSRGRVGGEDVLVACVSDITERRKAERELEEATERFLLLSENIDQVFWIASPDRGAMLYVSPAVEKIWGRSGGDGAWTPERWAESIDPEDRGRVLDGLLERQLSGTYAETYRIRRPDGQQRWIYDRAWPVRDSSGDVYRIVGITTDITERHLLEQKMNQAQKLEAIGTLAGGIAHDFNNILGAIMGHAELAALEQSNPGVKHSLDEILTACRRASDLVSQILSFSRQQDRKRVPLRLDQVVGEAARLMRSVLPSSLELSIQLSPTAPVVLADPTQVHQVVVNLCTNAMHAMEGRPGARLGVVLEPFPAGADFVQKHPGARAGNYAVLSVSDNGCGMDRRTVDRIFDPFFTTKAPGKGTGLGLSVVHGIANRHSAIIEVESVPGEGTTFRLYFPEHLEPVNAAGAVEREPVTGTGQRILVVDDEDPLVRLAGQILRKLGYQPEVHRSPQEALVAFRASPESYDLVLTDQTMPGMTGLELASLVTHLRSGIPVLLMTGLYTNLTEPQLKAAGITEVLHKPVDLRSLSCSVERALNSIKKH